MCGGAKAQIMHRSSIRVCHARREFFLHMSTPPNFQAALRGLPSLCGTKLVAAQTVEMERSSALVPRSISPRFMRRLQQASIDSLDSKIRRTAFANCFQLSFTTQLGLALGGQG